MSESSGSGGWAPPQPQPDPGPGATSQTRPAASWAPPAPGDVAYAGRPPLPAGGAGPGWPAFPHPEPREYHQMLLTWNYRWWRPVVGVLICAVAMLVLAPLVLLPVLAVGVAMDDGPFFQRFFEAATLQTIDAANLLYLNLVLASLIPITWLVMRTIHNMRPRWLTSVVPRMRWRLLLACLGVAVVALVAQVLVSLVLPGQTESDVGRLNDFTATSAAILVVVLLTTPFQAAGEEYLFRGYGLMAVGAFFPARWVAIVVTAALFAVAHGLQNAPLFLDRFAFGLVAGWLVVRTGGLEAGIALHVLNNFLAYGFALAFGDLTRTLTVSEVSWWNLPLTLTQSLVYAGLVLLLARRWGLQTRTDPPVARVDRTPLEAAPAGV